MGFYGDKCEFQCARDKWGLKCERNCSCGEHGRCDGDTGACVCDAGYIGRKCDKRCKKRFGDFLALLYTFSVPGEALQC